MGKDLTNIAELNNLEVIETTSEANGYPSNLKYAIIGFKNFEEAEKLAEEFDLEITTFTKKDGWNLWSRTGNNTYKPFENSSEDYGDNYQEIGKLSEEDFIENEVKWFFENEIESFEQINSFLKQKQEIWEEIEKMEDNQAVITHEGRYYETIDKNSMYFYHDTKHYAIGLQEK